MTREAELELEIARLREALDTAAHRFLDMGEIALANEVNEASTPPSTTALQELITEVERRTIERCAREVGDGIFGHDECAKEIRALPTGNLKLEDLK